MPPISYNIDQWLKQAGYSNYCFISWPHNVNQYIVSFAERLEEEIRNELAFQITGPKVFLDKSDIQPGAVWSRTLQNELCTSICMVALCPPVYFNPHHEFCGLEWAAMEELGQRRLQDPSLKAIVPIKVSDLARLPVAIDETQWIDVKHGRLRRRFLHTDEFKTEVVTKIVERIADISQRIFDNQVRAGCSNFRFPTQSAFANFNQQRPPLPLSA